MSDRIVHRMITYHMHSRGKDAETCIRLPMTEGYAEMLDRDRIKPTALNCALQALALMQGYDSGEYVCTEREDDI